jgi:hypothetical protein
MARIMEMSWKGRERPPDKVSGFTPWWFPRRLPFLGGKRSSIRGRHETILTRFDERSLRWIAETTGGSTHRSLTGQELEGFFEGIVRQERKIEGFKKVVEYEDTYRGF